MAIKETRSFLVTPTITSTPYADGDALGAVFAVSEAARAGGLIDTITVVDLAGQKKTVDLIVFNAEPGTPAADNTAFALHEDDAGKVLGTIQVADTDYIDIGSDALATVSMTTIQFGATADGALYGQLVIRAAGTYAASALRIRIGVTRD